MVDFSKTVMRLLLSGVLAGILFVCSKSPYKIIKRIITEIEIIKFIRGNLVISTSIILGRGGMNRTFA